jgi:hypothetical protein
LEREAFVREGWSWCAWPQQGEIVAQDPQRGTFARIDAYPAIGPPVTYSGWVDSAGTITTLEETDGEPVERPTYRVQAVQQVNGGHESN